MYILAIETSCDETGIALLEASGGLSQPQFRIVEEILSSQIEIHRPWGGVVPGLAKREHEKNLPTLFNDLKPTTDKLKPEIIAVTVGPGLEPCLWSGITFTQEIHKKYFSQAQLVGVNHMEGHLYSFLLSKTYNLKPNISDLFPAIALVVSGGHTMLVHMTSLTDWKVLGETRDDAVGEAFDKVGRLLGLSYPGGPEIEKLATESKNIIEFPRPMLHSKDYDFSLSGLKTAVLYYMRDNKGANKADVAAGFQDAALEPLVAKARRAVREYGAKSLMLSGGVAVNKKLRSLLQEIADGEHIPFLVASQKYNTDNAVMIAVAAYIAAESDKALDITAQANLGL